MLVRMRNRYTWILGLLLAMTTFGQTQRPLRLYIFDCGTIGAMNPALYNLKAEEIKGPITLVTPCYLIVHSRGTLLWDAGQIADEAFPADGKPATSGVFVATKKLLPQLAAVGYKPSDITYFALSHYHSDHTANANAFARLDVDCAGARMARYVRRRSRRHSATRELFQAERCQDDSAERRR